MGMEEKLVRCVMLGIRMRDAQKAFYANKDGKLRLTLLSQSKHLEKEYDQTAKYVIMLHEGRSSELP
jgi:hypothetical protein